MSVAEMVRDLVDESVESMELAAHNGFHLKSRCRVCRTNRCARMPHRQLAMPAALRAHHHSRTRSRVTGRTAAMTAVSDAHRPPRRTAAGKGTTKNARNTE